MRVGVSPSDWDIEKIRSKMKDSGRSLTWYAKFIGISRGHMSSLLCGHRAASLQVMKLIAVALEVPENEIRKMSS